MAEEGPDRCGTPRPVYPARVALKPSACSAVSSGGRPGCGLATSASFPPSSRAFFSSSGVPTRARHRPDGETQRGFISCCNSPSPHLSSLTGAYIGTLTWGYISMFNTVGCRAFLLLALVYTAWAWERRPSIYFPVGSTFFPYYRNVVGSYTSGSASPAAGICMCSRRQRCGTSMSSLLPVGSRPGP